MVMKPLKTALGMMILGLTLTGCASQGAAPAAESAPPKTEMKVATTLPSIKPQPSTADANPQQVSQLLVVWVAGYCQGWADATGGNFEMCFQTTTEDTIQKYKDRTGIDLTKEAAEAVKK